MQHFGNIVLWVYIVLLVVGGLMGFRKGSKISLIMSASFAAALILCVTGVISPSIHLDIILMAALLVFFAVRLTKGKKFMPAGLMVILTILALVLRNVHF